jgi:hypothetical protein
VEKWSPCWWRTSPEWLRNRLHESAGSRASNHLPDVEVHISNIAKRGIHCVLSDVAEGFITGLGTYILGLGAMLEILRALRQETRP